jgi:hypothetical protein
MTGVTVSAQVATSYFDKKNAFDTFKVLNRGELNEEASSVEMPSFDVKKLLEEDAQMKGLDVPFRFGHGFDVSYTLSDGKWETRNDKRI